MNAKRKFGLGKGLGSLLSDTPVETEVESVEEVISFEISLDAIETNPFQPRTQFDSEALNELKESIQVQGVIQPIAVRKVGERYQLISGERRLKASKLAGLKTIPAYVREATDNQMLELGIIENVQRENLNAMEIALAYQRLIQECDLKQEELGARVGKDRTTVNNYLRLLTLPTIVQEGLAEKKLSMGHARALLGIENESQLVKIYHEVVDNQLSVRKVEELVKSLNAGGKTTTSSSKKTSNPVEKRFLESYQNSFGDIFKKKVLVQADEVNKGEIKILYGSRIELEEIIAKLKK
jgi:ParB family chromosome partitioning protein